jgi:hypothetical protein
MRVDPEIGMDFMSKCAGGTEPEQADSWSKCASESESTCLISRPAYSSELLEETRALCTLPDSAHPAMTFLLDVLESRSCNDASKGSDKGIGNYRSTGSYDTSSGDIVSCSNTGSGTSGASYGANCASGAHDYTPLNPELNPKLNTELNPEPTMSIRFFLPRELYGVWNEAVRRYLTIISPDDGIELLAEGEGADRFIAHLLGDYLSTEHAHHKAARNSRILERDGYQCQVPGCSNRRNLHAHHLEFRSQGGCDEPWNELCLCACHHLWILHYLHSLKIEGTAPHNLIFTFGANSGPEGEPFMIYRNGRKILAPLQEKEEQENFCNNEQAGNIHRFDEDGLSHNGEGPGQSHKMRLISNCLSDILKSTTDDSIMDCTSLRNCLSGIE